MSPYYPGPSGIQSFTRAKAGDVNANLMAIAESFALMPEPSALGRFVLLPEGVPEDYAGMFLGVGLNGVPQYSSGVGTDLALRADLLSSTGATRVGYRQQGTGGLLRSLGDMLGEMPITPESFGGGAGGDDTTAFLRCVQRAIFTGQRISAKGTYRVSQINLSAPGILLDGGETGTIVKIPGTVGLLVNITGNGCRVIGMKFDASTANQIDFGGHTTNDIIRIDDASGCLIERCTLIGSGGMNHAPIDVGGGGVAIYRGSANIVQFCAIYGVRDNSIFVGGANANRNRILFNICSGTYAQNNIFVTASPNSAPVPGVFISDNIVSGNICRNSGDTNIEFGIHTIGSICTNNNLMDATNPPVLMRDSTNFVISGNIIVAINGMCVDGISVVPASESADWEAFGTIDSNIVIGQFPRSGVYIGQSRVKVNNNYISRPMRGEAIPANGSSLLGYGVLIGNSANNCDVTSNKIRGFAVGVEFNFPGALNTRHAACTVKNNDFEYVGVCINFYGCVGSKGFVISGNNAVGVRTVFLKGENSVIVPTGTYPEAQLRCFGNTVDFEGFTQVGVMYTPGITPADGLLTSNTARLGIVPETVDAFLPLGSKAEFGAGMLFIRFIGSPTSGSFHINDGSNNAVRAVSTADMFGSDGTTAGWSINGFSNVWNIVRRASATGVGPRYFVYDFKAI